MRVHVYHEELTNEFTFVEKFVKETGKTYYGFRIWFGVCASTAPHIPRR